MLSAAIYFNTPINGSVCFQLTFNLEMSVLLKLNMFNNCRFGKKSQRLLDPSLTKVAREDICKVSTKSLV